MRLSTSEWNRRLDAVDQAYSECTLCPHRCGVNRNDGELGFCKVGAESRVYRELLHFGEEPHLCPSYTVYVSGCSMRCVFCSEWTAVTQPSKVGLILEPSELALRIDAAVQDGAKTVNFVGGVPDVNLKPILTTLSKIKSEIKVVWNTNHYVEPAVLELLDGVVDVWLVDFKFGNQECAQELSAVSDYFPIVWDRMRSLDAMHGDLLIRHLVMPNHVECCTIPVLQGVHQSFPKACLNVMSEFIPLGQSRGSLHRRVSSDEVRRVREVLHALDREETLWNGYPFRSSEA